MRMTEELLSEWKLWLFPVLRKYGLHGSAWLSTTGGLCQNRKAGGGGVRCSLGGAILESAGFGDDRLGKVCVWRLKKRYLPGRSSHPTLASSNDFEVVVSQRSRLQGVSVTRLSNEAQWKLSTLF